MSGFRWEIAVEPHSRGQAKSDGEGVEREPARRNASNTAAGADLHAKEHHGESLDDYGHRQDRRELLLRHVVVHSETADCEDQVDGHHVRRQHFFQGLTRRGGIQESGGEHLSRTEDLGDTKESLVLQARWNVGNGMGNQGEFGAEPKLLFVLLSPPPIPRPRCPARRLHTHL